MQTEHLQRAYQVAGDGTQAYVGDLNAISEAEFAEPRATTGDGCDHSVVHVFKVRQVERNKLRQEAWELCEGSRRDNR